MPEPDFDWQDRAEIVDQFLDALGDKVTIGWLPGAVLVGVSGSPAILSTPELRDRFAKATAEAERRAEAEECDAAQFGEYPSVADGRCRCLVCSHCGHHTASTHTGHFSTWCSVTKTVREFHACCPDPAFGCELEASRG